MTIVGVSRILEEDMRLLKRRKRRDSEENSVSLPSHHNHGLRALRAD